MANAWGANAFSPGNIDTSTGQPIGAPPPGAPPTAPPAGAPPAAADAFPDLSTPGAPFNLPGIGPVARQPDGTYKDSRGVIIKSDGNGHFTVDPDSLALVTAIAKGQAQPGGLPPGSYIPNSDGTLTIIDPKIAPAGTILAKNGEFMNPDGTPYSSSTDGSNTPRWATRTPSGQPATDNPNFNGDGVLTNGDKSGLLDQVPGFDSAKDLANKLLDGLKNAATPGAPIDTSAATADHDRAMALADALSGQANAAGAQADTDRGLGTQTRAQQEDSIAGLQGAANGTAPSAAELQLKQQSGIDAARQYGLAAALQGNNPGAALRQASMGAAQVAGTTNQNAAINRANEQATARGQLATTLANVRSGDQGNVNTDVNQQTSLNTASGTASGQGTTSTGQQITAQTEKEKADAARAGALIGAGGTAAATLLSDRRAKKNIAKASLADALGKEVHGVTFTYKPEVEEDDDPHFGILADALEKVIPGVVKKGPSGFKEVHTGHLALANVGVTAELARRLQDLEKGKGARR